MFHRHAQQTCRLFKFLTGLFQAGSSRKHRRSRPETQAEKWCSMDSPSVNDIVRKALVEQIAGNYLESTRCFLLAFKIQPSVAPSLRDEFLTGLRSLSKLSDEPNTERKPMRSKPSSRLSSSFEQPHESHQIQEPHHRELQAALPLWRLASSVYPNDVEVQIHGSAKNV